ncbi:xenotropic and polytropic retrovirus receptor 1 homolog [Erpetoichthys calabaricus]|uniref:xenotropic and polytropic retrovirus receptor 1 homolog n=1 Tax=Erpetoichthys calabaricus TaxID=27687 RepID=UPI002234DA5D|nr:xenotropic and polytropic retrovirus receptor 1 homolog [Erpetoichthys calabaricus]
MKFSEHLAAHLTPEWRKQYICYGVRTEALYANVGEAPSIELFDPTIIQRYDASLQEMFFQMCERELVKISLFYAEKLAEAQRRLATLHSDMDAVFEVQKERHLKSGQRKRGLARPHSHIAERKTLQDLKLAFSELYLSLVLLQNYQNLNYTGFCKILRKHDKTFDSCQGGTWQAENVDVSPFHTGKKTEQLIAQVESLVCQMEGGDRQKAMKRLRVPPLGAAQPAPVWTTFRVGVHCGLLLALAALLGFSAFRASEQPLTWPLLRLYRGGFLLIEFIFLLGINIYGWKKAGVNHILIFELDPRDHLSYQHMFELAGVLGVSWCISLLACLHSTFLSIPLQLNPLLFYGFALLLLLNPTRTCYYRSRLWLLRLLGRVLTAPFHKVGFADFWLADQLISLSPLLLDLWSLICFYAIEVNWHSLQTLNAPPTEQLDCSGYSRGMTCLIQCFPPWIRFAQCLRRYRDTGSVMPHLFNAGKYSTVFIMVTFAAIYNNARERPQLASGVKVYLCLWVLTTCLSAIATITWDLRMDWGLVRGQRLLREETVYSHAAYYYCAMLLDVLLRVSWALNVSFAQMKQSDTAGFITTVLAPLEVFRRFIWNFFRLENEHLNNCGQFRAVRDISITPLTAEGQAALERLMDQEDRARESRKQAATNRKSNFSFRHLR